MARSAVNRWIRDRIEAVQTPTQYIRKLEKTIEGIHPRNRTAAITYAREYAVLYYGERHKHTPVPYDVVTRLDRLEKHAEKAEHFDRARAFLDKLGSPEKALATFMKAPVLEKARVEVQQTKTHERDFGPSTKGYSLSPTQINPLQTLTPEQRSETREAYEKSPAHEKESLVDFSQRTTKEKALRGHDIPWMMTTGPVHEMSRKHLDRAAESYQEWPHKEKYSFVEYVNLTRSHWSKSPEDRQPAKQHEKSREMELSR